MQVVDRINSQPMCGLFRRREMSKERSKALLISYRENKFLRFRGGAQILQRVPVCLQIVFDQCPNVRSLLELSDRTSHRLSISLGRIPGATIRMTEGCRSMLSQRKARMAVEQDSSVSRVRWMNRGIQSRISIFSPWLTKTAFYRAATSLLSLK